MVLEHAAGLAVEKAREMGLALVRVARIDRLGSAAAVTAGIATGPFAGLAIGPGDLLEPGAPFSAGLPVVIDSGLGATHGRQPARGTPRVGPRQSSGPRAALPGAA